jgi:GH15 family glucan-1,4-alpha-glucosidase
MKSRIEDYAMIGDCETAALVGIDGSIDWLCFQRFDASACFAALLGTAENGRWLLAPQGEVKRVARRYREGTLVLETEIETEEGTVVIVDAMPPRHDGPQPDGRRPHLVRLVEGKRGRVPMQMELILRFDYGSIVPWVRSIDGSLRAIGGRDGVRLVTPIALHGKDFTTVASFVVEAGDRVPFVLSWHLSYEDPPPAIDATKAITETTTWWQEWSRRCTIGGPWQGAVLRSLVTLKGLTSHRTGGIVAAPTTSLPEEIGGVRNWDYRYCWVRDATFTLLALLQGGFNEEAAAWREWLLRAVAGKTNELQIMYGVGGERRLTEFSLPHLPGYEGSSPVRIGNAASTQVQLDVYGELMDCLYLCGKGGLAPEESAWDLQLALLASLEEIWERPDNGIWEVRGPHRHFTHSKMMAWVAIDRAIKSVESFGAEGPVDRWRATRQTIFDEVCREGWSPEIGAFTQSYGSKDLDASLLMMPLVGFLPASDPRVSGTIAAIQANLVQDGFVNRYSTHEAVDGVTGRDASFIPCTFWLADCLALQGKYGEARAIFEQLLAIRNDVGLLSEEYDPRAKRMLGNFPQAFSHVALIHTALNLAPRDALGALHRGL